MTTVKLVIAETSDHNDCSKASLKEGLVNTMNAVKAFHRVTSSMFCDQLKSRIKISTQFLLNSNLNNSF